MTTIYVLGRCLACWAMTVAPVQVERHLPAAFKAVCARCGCERQYAVTGQVYNTLSAATLRQLKGAQQRKVRPDWEQLPLVDALIPHDPPDPAPGATTQFHQPSRATHDAGPAKGMR